MPQNRHKSFALVRVVVFSCGHCPLPITFPWNPSDRRTWRS